MPQRQERMSDAYTITIGQETEKPNRWDYDVVVEQGGRRHEYLVSLSWSDYDLWCHGRVAPEKVVDAIFRFLLERESASSILSKFDCSLVRRYFAEVDAELPKMV
jgi:hypothetical protein